MQLTEQDIADFLLATPDFFERHASLLSQVQLVSPYGHGAVSLQERQMQLLREKNRMLELRTADMIRHAQENDAIQSKLSLWCAEMLRETEPAALPERARYELSRIFVLPMVALKLFDLDASFSEIDAAKGFSADAASFAHSLTLPYCGMNTGFEAASWMGQSGDVKSLAMIALRSPKRDKAFGLLALGSADPERFKEGMGTEFLWKLGELSSAALSRLL
jgi:uncharacterized protein